MNNVTVEDLKILKNIEVGPRGGFLDRHVEINWGRFLPDGTTLGIGSDGRYYKTDRSQNPRKMVEVSKDEYFKN